MKELSIKRSIRFPLPTNNVQLLILRFINKIFNCLAPHISPLHLSHELARLRAESDRRRAYRRRLSAGGTGSRAGGGYSADLGLGCWRRRTIDLTKADPDLGFRFANLDKAQLMADLAGRGSGDGRWISRAIGLRISVNIGCNIQMQFCKCYEEYSSKAVMYLPCTGCDSYHLQPFGRTVAKNKSVRYLPDFGPIVAQECIDCGKKYNMGGPIWSAPIHDQEWVTSILEDVMAMKDGYPAYDRILLSLQHFQRNFLMCHCFSVCTTFVRLSSALPHHSHSTPVCIIGVFRSSKSREKPESILSKLNQRTASKLDDVEVSVSSVKSSEVFHRQDVFVILVRVQNSLVCLTWNCFRMLRLGMYARMRMTS